MMQTTLRRAPGSVGARHFLWYGAPSALSLVLFAIALQPRVGEAIFWASAACGFIGAMRAVVGVIAALHDLVSSQRVVIAVLLTTALVVALPPCALATMIMMFASMD